MTQRIAGSGRESRTCSGHVCMVVVCVGIDRSLRHFRWAFIIIYAACHGYIFHEIPTRKREPYSAREGLGV